MKVDVILGLQWGDEGKGKIVDKLAPHYDVIARFQGGANAGHTINIKGDTHILHLIPSGIFHEDKINIIGNGVIVDPFILNKEITELKLKDVDATKNLFISKKAHLILPTHRVLDGIYERTRGDAKVGSTLKGIGPTYTDKAARNGIRIGDIIHPSFSSQYIALKEEHLRISRMFNCNPDDLPIDGLPFRDYEARWFDAIDRMRGLHLIDSEFFINKCLGENKSVLAEGAQGTMLDVDFGTYPYVTSSNTICSGVCSGLGVAPQMIGKVYGIIKAYTTRVGSGPFPTELMDDQGDLLRVKGHEYGSTTGRPRRCGWLDLVAVRYAVMLNGVSHLIMTKADVLNGFECIKVCKHYQINDQIIDHFPYCVIHEPVIPLYDELAGWKTDISRIEKFKEVPVEFMTYLRYIESSLGIKFVMVSTGSERDQMLISGEHL
ncbi:MAG: adenylosuccinate synthase [Bacteroidetes bacterium]|nr:adenylosuccinate synthase [Bacteroidota bacterium]